MGARLVHIDLFRKERWVPKQERPPSARAAIPAHHNGRAAREIHAERQGVRDRGRAQDELRARAVRCAEPKQSAHHERDMRPKHAAVHVRLIEHDVPGGGGLGAQGGYIG